MHVVAILHVLFVQTIPECLSEFAPLNDTLRMRIHVHGVVAQEADEGDAAGVGQFDGQARGGGDGSDTGDAGQQGFLDDLE